MSFYIKLLEMTDHSRRQLESQEKVQKMLNGALSKQEYQRFLMDLYHIVLHFCPIMAAAAGRLPVSFETVRDHLYHNIDEEQGHEKMVLADLKTFGMASEKVKTAQPSKPVEAMLAYNYYASERVHACSVLGMLYVLEIISSVYGGQVAASIAEGLNMSLAEGGFSFLDSHASMDLDHMEHLTAVLKTIVDPAVQDIVIRAIQMNFYLFTEFLKH